MNVSSIGSGERGRATSFSRVVLVGLVGLAGLTGLVGIAACGGAQEPPPAAPSVAPPAAVGIGDGAAPSPARAARSGDAKDVKDLTIPREKAGPSASTPTPAGTLPQAPPRPVSVPLVPPGEDSPYASALKPADEAFEKDDLDGALKGYEAARKIAPKRGPAIVGVARTKVAKTNVPFEYAAGKKNAVITQAAADLAKVTESESDYGPAFAELGRAQLLLGEGLQAVTSLKRATQLLPEHAEVQSSLGVAQLASGRVDDALASFKAAAAIDPGSAVRHGHYATALLLRGNVKDAIAEYEVAVRLAPNDARAHSDLGAALLANNDPARATSELNRAIELDGKRATFRSNLGYALQLQGKVAEAVAQYREALKLDPKLASAWLNLATALARDPKTLSEARSAWDKARAIDPTDPRVSAIGKELEELEKKPKK